MGDVWIVGTHGTPFAKRPDTTFKALTREAYTGVLGDAGIDPASIGSVHFGNVLMHTFGQGGVRGQACTVELVDEGLLPRHVPIVNVEGACATASMALYGAIRDVRAGECEVALALGVEKTFRPGADTDPAIRKEMFDAYGAGVDNFDLPRLVGTYQEAAAFAGCDFAIGPGRTMFMDTYAMQAAVHMKRWGTTQAHIAAGAAKNHTYGAANPSAQYRFVMTPDEVLADREVSYPLTRSMCAPIGDGAAAAIVCSEAHLRTLPAAVQARAVRVAAGVLTGGRYRGIEDESLSAVGARRAYERAGVTPADIDVAEVHDATSFCEIHQLEQLGFCALGQGGPFVAAGESGPDGRIPTNTSGGLVSKGHPVGATGLSMIHELTLQLRGEAGARQVPDARLALAENGGGVVGLEEFACAITILERA
jgi:acetyl-CoA acetyltransferase